MCVCPAEFPSIQPGLGNLPFPFSPSQPLSQPLEPFVPGVPRHFPMHSKENKKQQLNTRTDISNMWLSTCFFQVLGDFFPSWGRQELLTQRAPTPSESHSGFLTRMFPAASFPQAAGIFLLTLQCSLSLLSLSTPPGWISGHVQSDTLQQGAPGQPCPVGVHTPGLSAAHPSSWLRVPQGFRRALAGPEPRRALDAVVGHCQADVVAVT